MEDTNYFQRLLSLLLVLILVPVFAACSGVKQSPRVVFAHRGDQLYEVYSGNVDDHALKLMTTIKPQDFSESFGLMQIELSSTGKHLAYFDADGLYVADLNVGKVELISKLASPIGPRGDILKWSPDGMTLAFYGTSALDETITEVYVYHVDTQETVDLTNGQLKPSQVQFSWSPNNQYLAFPTIPGPEYSIVDVLSGTIIGHTELDLPISYPGTLGVCNSAWSPDGKYLAFAVGCSSTEPALWYETYIMDVSKGEVIPVTNLMQAEHSGTVIAQMKPYWSPREGTLLVQYAYGRPSFLEEPQLPGFSDKGFIVFDTATLSISSNNDALMPSVDRYIAWSQDNALVWRTASGWQFASVSNGDIAKIGDIDIPLGCWPSWSPDGAFFAYTGTQDPLNCRGAEDKQIYVVNPTTGGATEISTSLGGHNLLLGWMQP